MPILKWNNDLSVGNEEIDDQHKKIINILGKLYEGLKKDDDRNHLAIVLNEIINFALFHFETEERYMQQNNFYGYEEHKKEHHEFVVKIGQFKKDFDNDKAKLNMDIYNFLKDWVENHLMNVDQEYKVMFKK